MNKFLQSNAGAVTKKLAPPNSRSVTPGTPSLAEPAIEALVNLSAKRDTARKVAEQKARGRTLARSQAISEQLAIGAEEVSAAIAEASGAVQEIRKTMQSISSASEESGSAAEGSRAAITQIEKAANSCHANAIRSREFVGTLLQQVRASSAEITSLLAWVTEAANASIESSRLISELEALSHDIGNIVSTVAGVADQTNLLALNAAIEASRAGENGRGFAVVAEEVRILAGRSEKGAVQVQQIVEQIQEQVKVVAREAETAGNRGRTDAEEAKSITADLGHIEKSCSELHRSAEALAANSSSLVAAGRDYLIVAEQIASAASEAAAGCTEALRSVEEQEKAFGEIAEASEGLSTLAESLRSSTDTQKTSEELAAAAEELSANADETKAAAAQIATAIEQIDKSARLQTRSCEEAVQVGGRLAELVSDANGQSERGVQQMRASLDLLDRNKVNVEKLVASVAASHKSSSDLVQNVASLDDLSRSIEKSVDEIVMISLQTNMLAVNGSIEAARVGEFGRGFSVVASDVRTLATESAESVGRIKDIVRRIQNQIRKVSGMVELAARRSAEEAGRVNASMSGIALIEATTKQVAAGMEEIGGAMGETAAAVEEANRASEHIGTAAAQIAQASTQAAGAAAESSKASIEIAQAVEEIASKADDLQSS